MKRIDLAASLTAALLLISGCGPTGEAPAAKTADGEHDHDHGHEHGEEHHHAETLAEAITELTSMRDAIRDAFAKNDTETAHGPLHDVGHVLELIPGLAEKQGISGDALTTIRTSTEQLFEAFGAVDKTLHGEEGSTYSEESAKIDAALQALTAAAAGTAPAAAPAEPAATETPSSAPPATDAPPAADAPPADAPASESAPQGSGT